MDMIKLDDLRAYRDDRIASGDSDFDEMDRLSAFIANVETVDISMDGYNDASLAYAIGWENGEDAERSRRKRGEWKEINTEDYKALCSSCGTWSPIMGNYCPNCGASMTEREGKR